MRIKSACLWQVVYWLGVWLFYIFVVQEPLRTAFIDNWDMLQQRLVLHDNEIMSSPLSDRSERLEAIDRKTAELFDNWHVLLAGSESYFDRIKNILGSIHFHEPLAKCVVLDLGMTTSKTTENFSLNFVKAFLHNSLLKWLVGIT